MPVIIMLEKQIIQQQDNKLKKSRNRDTQKRDE